MGWKKTQETFDAQKGGLFVKLEDDGDTVIASFPWVGDGDTDDPIPEETYYNEKDGNSEPYTPEHKAKGLDANIKIKFGCVVRVEGVMQEDAKILSATVTTAKQIQAAIIKYTEKSGGKPVWLEIKRNGAKGNKKTKYSVMYEAHMSDEEIEKMKKTERPSMERPDDDGDDKKGKKNGAAKAAQANGTSTTTSQGVSSETNAKIAETLKGLPDPRAAIGEFLKTMGVSRLSEVLAKDEKKALETVEIIKQKMAPPAENKAAAPAEVDPFS